MGRLSPTDIVDEVREILARNQLGRSTRWSFMSVYQILAALPPTTRRRLMEERGRPGRGAGNAYTAAHVVAEAARSLGAEVVYANSRQLHFEIDDEPIQAGYQVCALYRLATGSDSPPLDTDNPAVEDIGSLSSAEVSGSGIAPRMRDGRRTLAGTAIEQAASALGVTADVVIDIANRLTASGVISRVKTEAVEAGESERIQVRSDILRTDLPTLEASLVAWLLGVEIAPGHPFVSRTSSILGGEWTIRGTRIPTELVSSQILHGREIADVLADFPHVTRREVIDALHFELDRRGGAGAAAA